MEVQASPTATLPRWLSSRWLRPVSDIGALNDWLSLANPLWSLTDIRAVVVEVIDETADTKTFVLRPNRHWKGYRAGQHVIVGLEIDGMRCQRAFTLASAPAAGRELRLTVKRQSQGRVTGAMHERLKLGDVVTLSPAMGDFVLPDLLPAKLLLLSAGSGITPLLSMLRQLHAQDYDGDVVFLHAARSDDDTICGDELKAMAAEWPALRLALHYSSEQGRLDPQRIAGQVPDLADRDTFLCGPDGFMQAVIDDWSARGLSPRLRYERFGAPRPRPRAEDDGSWLAQVRCSSSEQVFTSAGAGNLLEEAERAGLKPKSGCRIGICHSCQCRKLSGTVENLLTGQLSSAPGEMIQLCVSRAGSDLVIEL